RDGPRVTRGTSQSLSGGTGVSAKGAPVFDSRAVGGDGQRERNRRAGAGPVGYPDGAAAGFDQPLTDGQPKAASLLAATVAAHLVEDVEHLRALGGRNAFALIADAELDMVANLPRRQTYRRTGRREFDRVADEVDQHLTNALAVGENGRQRRRIVVLNGMA